MAEHKATKRLYLITNPKKPDVFMGMAESSDSEPSPTLDAALADSRRSHPANGDAPAAS
jgi:hypothetical protein